MAPLSVGVFDGMRNSLLTVSCVGGVMVWLTALSTTDTFSPRALPSASSESARALQNVQSPL